MESLELCEYIGVHPFLHTNMDRYYVFVECITKELSISKIMVKYIEAAGILPSSAILHIFFVVEKGYSDKIMRSSDLMGAVTNAEYLSPRNIRIKIHNSTTDLVTDATAIFEREACRLNIKVTHI